MLVIDHYVPQPDKDAGSRTMAQFMALFQEMGACVKFWPRNSWFDPDYTPPLQQFGIEVFHQTGTDSGFESWIRECGGEIDIFLLSRPDVADNFVDLIRAHSTGRILYYGHDIHHLRLRHQSQLEPDNLALLAESNRLEAIEQQVWRSVDVIYYPSDPETTYVARYLATSGYPGKAVTIPVYGFESFPDNPESNLAQRADLLFVAGFGHKPNIDAAVWFVSVVLPILRTRFPTVRLTLVGSNPTPEVRALAEPGIVVTGHISDEELAAAYQGARVAIAPLRFGAGMKGKVVEAMRYGVPVVSTSIGVQGLEAIKAAIPPTDNPLEFADRAGRLLEDDLLWRNVSAEVQAYARQHFSRDAMRRIFAADLLAPSGDVPNDAKRTASA
jgi:glycosyltransferase involved in cell wall biosynthesis